MFAPQKLGGGEQWGFENMFLKYGYSCQNWLVFIYLYLNLSSVAFSLQI